jgi:hypothetical protein
MTLQEPHRYWRKPQPDMQMMAPRARETGPAVLTNALNIGIGRRPS